MQYKSIQPKTNFINIKSQTELSDDPRSQPGGILSGGRTSRNGGKMVGLSGGYISRWPRRNANLNAN